MPDEGPARPNETGSAPATGGAAKPAAKPRKPKAQGKDAKWAEAKKKLHLSAKDVRMAKALGMNPAKLGKIANHKQEPWKAPWKAPLRQFIGECYDKRFGDKGR